MTNRWATRTLLVCRATSKPVCICVAAHSKRYVGACAFCCYLKQYWVSAWNATSDLRGKTEPVQHRWINIFLLCTDLGTRSPRQELTQGKILSQISWYCLISINLSLCFANNNEVSSHASAISVFFFFSFSFYWEWNIFFCCLESPAKAHPYFWCWMQSMSESLFSSAWHIEFLFI